MNFSQDDLADQIGTSRVAVSHWEKGTVREIERRFRIALCKVLGFDEAELLLDRDGAERDFDMPLSRQAKRIAHRWDDLPGPVRGHLERQIAEVERLIRESPETVKRLYPDLEDRDTEETT